jgi:hypothetical protein
MAAVDVAPSVAMGMSQVRTQAIRLFAVGFLVLFMELACIRWFATYVIFLQFFTNVILIASFLGMSCGCLAAGAAARVAALFSVDRARRHRRRAGGLHGLPLLERPRH